jgi:two-component system CheB/CheR fusion protein
MACDFRPDAVLLDIGLPRMDGFEVAARLRALPDFERILIVAASGYGGENDRLRASQVGIDLYLVKPFDPWQLAPILDSHRASSVAVPA